VVGTRRQCSDVLSVSSVGPGQAALQLARSVRDAMTLWPPTASAMRSILGSGGWGPLSVGQMAFGPTGSCIFLANLFYWTEASLRHYRCGEEDASPEARRVEDATLSRITVAAVISRWLMMVSVAGRVGLSTHPSSLI
jgi:hypothetical protein